MIFTDYKERLVQRIKNIGQEIIDRAEEIADPEFMTDLSIHAYIGMGPDEFDTLEWNTEAVVTNTYKHLMKKGE